MKTPLPESRASVVYLSHGDIAPSPTNPRKHCDPTALEELKKSLLSHGFTAALSHLLVRPLPDGSGYELICGERRWRAAGELIADGKLSAEVPAVVLPLTDLEALELQMVENMQRSDLTPLEEAEGLQRLLKLRGFSDDPLHTVESLATKLGRTVQHVRDRLALLSLRGSAAGDALEAGDIGVAHARLLARVPAGKMRDELTRRVLKPIDGNAPLPKRMLEKIIRHEFVVELRGAAFDTKSADLLPLELTDAGERIRGGACTDCPYNSKNDPDGASSKFHMCHNPECYRLKEDAHHAAWMADETNPDKQRQALSLDDGRALLDYSGVKLSHSSRHVDLAERPDEDLLKRGTANPPTWKRLLSGIGIPVKLLRDINGKVHEVVDAKLALETAREAEKSEPAAERIFRAAERESKKESAAQREERIKVEAEAGRLKRRVKVEMEKAVIHAALAAGNPPEALWSAALPVLHENARDFVESDNELPAEIPKKLKPSDVTEIIVRSLLILAGAVAGTKTDEEVLSAFAKVYGVDLKEIRKATEKAFAADAEAARQKAALAEMITWSSERKEADEFEWNESGVCTEPDRGLLSIPKGSDVKRAVITLARHQKGWVYGFAVTTKSGDRSGPVKSQGPFYDRPAAIRGALLSVKTYADCKVLESRITEFMDDLLVKASAAKKGGKKK